ncbi:MAG: AMP-binding protein [Desulfosudis oleivorans]|nr:AMP-binding protein [Desulfosudis oleivorans]
MYHYADAIEALADRLGDDIVLTHDGTNRSWREFDDRAARLGQAFADAGLAPGSKIGLLLYNCSEYYETFLAALKMRMVPFNINYRYVGAELAYLLENSDCEALVYHRSLADVVREVLPGLPQVKLAIEVDDDGDGWDQARAYEALVAETAPAPRIPRQPDDYHLMYTGGTTGLPKGVICHVTPWSTGLTAMYATERARAAGRTHADRAVARAPCRRCARRVSRPSSCPPRRSCTPPGSPTACRSRCWAAAASRCRTATSTRWRSGARSPGSAVMCLVIVGDAFARPMLAALEEAKARGETLDLTCLKLVVSSGVIWSQGVKEAMLERIDATLIDGVGATEGAMAMQLSRRGQTGAAAKFVPLADTRLFAEDGREIPKGSDEPGLIAAGGALLPAGYYKDPEKTAKTFRIVDGRRFAFIGDWGQWNADGTLQLLGRGSALHQHGRREGLPRGSGARHRRPSRRRGLPGDRYAGRALRAAGRGAHRVALRYRRARV